MGDRTAGLKDVLRTQKSQVKVSMWCRLAVRCRVRAPEHLPYADHHHGPCKHKGKKDHTLVAEKVHSWEKFWRRTL